MSEILEDYCCCTEFVLLDLYSSSCALQKLDLYLSDPPIAIFTLTSSKESCTFYNFSSFLGTVFGKKKELLKDLDAFL